MNADFSVILRKIMESEEKALAQEPDKVVWCFVSGVPTQLSDLGDALVPQVAEINEELMRTKQVMAVNIDRVLERGEKIELLVEKTAAMENNAVLFRRRTQEVKCSFCCAAYRTWLLGILVVRLLCSVQRGAWGLFCF